MSYTLETLKEEVWNAYAAVRLCKALDAIFIERKLQTSSPITTNIDTIAKLVHGILESDDSAECEKAIPQMKDAIGTAHKYWHGRVHESWESLTPKLDTLLENRCEHEEGRICTPCKLQRRIPIYGLLWADFSGTSASENTEYHKVTEMVLDNILIIMAARSEHAEDGGTCYLEPVSSGDEAVLVQLEKFNKPHLRATYWRELLQHLIEYSPVVRTRVQNRHTYEVTSEPGVAAVDA